MKVIIAKFDAVTAYGWGMNSLWRGLLGNRTAIKPMQRFSERGFVSNQAALVPGLEVEAKGSRVMAMLNRLLRPIVGQIDPTTPLILATTVGEIEFVERAILENSPDLAAESRPQALLHRVKELLQLRGTAMLISSACASSALAIAHAASMIRRAEHKAVLVVSCDAVSEFVYSGFSTLLSLCPDPARPFDADRGGLTLGEACAWALLTADDAGSKEHHPASIIGWGSSTDAIHMTAPDRSAAGLSRAIGKACRMAHRKPTEISFIAAHGTATLYSDAMEMVAFKNSIVQPRPVFSIKGGVGHTLASAGLLQVLVSAKAMDERVLPPTVGLFAPDASALGWVYNQSTPVDDLPLVLSTNSGFGGVNTALLLAGGGRK